MGWEMRGQERERAKNPQGFLKMFSSISQGACWPSGPTVSVADRCSVGGLPASQLSVPTRSARQPQLLNSGSVHQASESAGCC